MLHRLNHIAKRQKLYLYMSFLRCYCYPSVVLISAAAYDHILIVRVQINSHCLSIYRILGMEKERKGTDQLLNYVSSIFELLMGIIILMLNNVN